MSESIITVMDCMAQSMAITVLLSYFESDQNKKRIVGYFSIIFCIGLLFYFCLPNYAFFDIHCIIPFLIVYRKRTLKDTCQCVFSILFSLILFFIEVLLLGSLIYLIFGDKLNYGGFLYHFIFCVGSVLLSLLLRWYKDGELLCVEMTNHKGLFILNLFLYALWCFLTIVLPKLSFVSKDKFSYYLITLMFASFIFVLYIAARHIGRLEIMAHEQKLHIEYTKMDQRKIDAVIKLKHYYLRLYRYCLDFFKNGDTAEFQKKVHTYLTPIHENILADKVNMNKLYFIQSDLIRNLFFQFICDIFSKGKDSIDLQFDIEQPIGQFKIPELALYKILSSFMDNILDEVEKQEKSVISIRIIKIENKYLFKLINSCRRGSPPKNSFGMGTVLIQEIVAKYGNYIDFRMEQLGNFYLQAVKVKGDKKNEKSEI